MKQSIQLVTDNLFEEVSAAALKSTRKRSNYNFHELQEVYQRFLNVLTYGTYVQPHKHENPPKPESFLVLKGELGFFIFDDGGNIVNKYRLSEKGPIYGIDIQPGLWHSIVCLTEVCVCFEGKSGPYNPSNDKEFAAWAPSEADDNRMEYLQFLEKEL